jgi:UDP-N-acetyl-D-mannosaminuronic acid dehydrogenase
VSKVSVIGLGYIGLPTSVVAASKGGHTVFGVDINPKAVEIINSGKAHIEETGLDELVAQTISNGSFKAFTTVQPADVYLIIVPTPFSEKAGESKQPDMKYVRQAATDIAPFIKEGDLVVLESTSPVGATRIDVAEVILKLRPELTGKIHFAFCPERAIPGNTLHELVHNDRTVGGVDDESTQKAVEFYSSYIEGDILKTTSDTAEMVKLTENASRDVQIAFANELSLVCDDLRLDVWKVIELANHHPRVDILQPGPGVGGHCIAVDPWFIVASSPENTPLMRTAREVNDGKPDWVVSKVKKAVAEKSKTEKPVIGLLGLAFKPDVDDLRESPSVTVAKALQQATDAEIMVCEPYIQEHELFALSSLEKTLDESNIVVMLTDHKAFKEIQPELLESKIIIDTRGTFKGEK